MALSVEEFASKIKAKYPEYQNVDDQTLAEAIVKKYPEYKGKVALQNKSMPLTSAVYMDKYGMLPDEAKPAMQEALGEYSKAKEAADIASQNAMMPYGGVGVGIGKSALGTVKGMADLGVQGLEAVTGIKTGTVEGELSQQMDEWLEPKGTEQQVGKVIGDVGQFVLPAGALSKVGQAEKGASLGAKALGLGKKVVAEAATAGGIAAAQEGEIDEDSLYTAAIAGALPVIGKIPFKEWLQKASTGQVTKLIRPAQNAYTFGRNPAQAIVDEKIVAKNFDDLINKIKNKKTEIGKEMTEKIAQTASTKTFDATQAIKEVSDKFAKNVTDQTIWKNFSDKLMQLTGKFKPNMKTGELVRIGEKKLTNLTAEETWKLQQQVGKLTQWMGVAGEKQANKALHSLYGKLGKQLDEMVPGAKQLQGRWANLLGAEKSAVARKAVADRNSGIVGFSAGGIAGGMTDPLGELGIDLGPLNMPVNFALGGLGVKLGKSTMAKTGFSKFLNDIGTPKEEIEAVIAGLIKLGASQGNQS